MASIGSNQSWVSLSWEGKATKVLKAATTSKAKATEEGQHQRKQQHQKNADKIIKIKEGKE